LDVGTVLRQVADVAVPPFAVPAPGLVLILV